MNHLTIFKFDIAKYEGSILLCTPMFCTNICNLGQPSNVKKKKNLWLHFMTRHEKENTNECAITKAHYLPFLCSEIGINMSHQSAAYQLTKRTCFPELLRS